MRINKGDLISEIRHMSYNSVFWKTLKQELSKRGYKLVKVQTKHIIEDDDLFGNKLQAKWNKEHGIKPALPQKSVEEKFIPRHLITHINGNAIITLNPEHPDNKQIL